MKEQIAVAARIRIAVRRPFDIRTPIDPRMQEGHVSVANSLNGINFLRSVGER